MLSFIKSKTLVIIMSLLALSGFVGLYASPVMVSAASKDAVCGGFQEALGDGCGGTAGEEEINSTILDVIDILSAVVGVISVIMIIIAGVKYATASGDPGSIKSARNTIIYALVGLLVVAMSQTIVKYVVGKVVNNR